MFSTFGGFDANSVWRMAADALINGDSASQMTRLGESKELLHVSFQIADPKQRWINARTPGISPAFAIAEVFWILKGDNNANFMNYWNPCLPKFAGNCNTYHGAYGHRIRKQFGLDQLKIAYQALSANPDTRQVVIQLWDPRTDLPKSTGEPSNADIPCNICSMPKIRNNKLEWLQVARSNDVFLGLPYNIIQFTTLQEILAGWLNIKLGSYHQISDSFHAYSHDLEHYTIDRDCVLVENTDSLSLNVCESVEVINYIYRHLQTLTDLKLTKERLNSLISDSGYDIPISYNNLLLICCAYAAKKRSWQNEMHESIGLCKNETIVDIWNLWLTKNRK